MVLSRRTSAGVVLRSPKLLTRSKCLTAIVTLGLCSIVYLTFFLSGALVRTEMKRLLPADAVTMEVAVLWNGSPRRLVVFGDSWSDNGQYPIDPPTKDQLPSREEARGKISCAHHDNFARSLPGLWDSGYSGPVVDSSLFNETMVNMAGLSNSSAPVIDFGEPLADLKTQVQQWLRFEKQNYGTRRVSELERNGTIFIVWLSLWDSWYYSGKEIVDVDYPVKKTMDTLFEQLDVIAENWPSEVRTIMPEAIDLTFLPSWRSIRTGYRGSDPHGEIQKRAVALVQQWNRVLDMRASRWRRGSMYIYNTNEWLLDQIRDHQLIDSHVSDANGMGNTRSPWSNVRSGCVQAGNTSGSETEAPRCPDPGTYLFWDEMHLGPEAMRMIGEGIAQDIATDHGSSWFADDVQRLRRTKEHPHRRNTHQKHTYRLAHPVS